MRDAQTIANDIRSAERQLAGSSDRVWRRNLRALIKALKIELAQTDNVG